MVTWLAPPFFSVKPSQEDGILDRWQPSWGVGLAGREHGEQALRIRQKASSVEWQHEPAPLSSCLRCVLGATFGSSCQSDFGLGLSYNGSGKNDIGESKATSASEATVNRKEWGRGNCQEERVRYQIEQQASLTYASCTFFLRPPPKLSGLFSHAAAVHIFPYLLAGEFKSCPNNCSLGYSERMSASPGATVSDLSRSQAMRCSVAERKLTRLISPCRGDSLWQTHVVMARNEHTPTNNWKKRLCVVLRARNCFAVEMTALVVLHISTLNNAFIGPS